MLYIHCKTPQQVILYSVWFSCKFVHCKYGSGTVFVCLAECPGSQGFTYAINGGIGTCLKLVTQKVKWSEATDECPGLHPQARLVVIDSYWKQTAVKNLIDGEDMCATCFVP